MLEKLWFLLLFPGLTTVGFFLWFRLWIRRRNERSRRPFNDMPRPAAFRGGKFARHIQANQRQSSTWNKVGTFRDTTTSQDLINVAFGFVVHEDHVVIEKPLRILAIRPVLDVDAARG